MKKVDFSELTAGVISDANNCIHSQDAYVGEKTYTMSIFKSREEKAFYVSAADGDMLVCIKNIREDLDKFSAEKAVEDLGRRMEGLFTAGETEICIVVNPDADADVLEQPLLIRISGKTGFKEEKRRRAVCSEFNDWMDEISVMLSAKSTTKQVEDFKKDYDKLMAGGKLTINGKIEEPKDYSGTMVIITLVLTVLGAIFRDTMIFSIMGLMAGGFSAYRCFANKNYKGMGVCLACIVACIIFAYLGWEGVKEGIQKQLK